MLENVDKIQEMIETMSEDELRVVSESVYFKLRYLINRKR